MINCPECGKEISDSAKKCPECGYPISKSKGKKKCLTIGIVVFAVILLLAASGTYYYLEIRLDETEREQVDNVITAITDIGDVSLISESKIVYTENLYSELSDVCQRHVSNYEDLKNARETYNNLRANQTANLITKIGEVTLDSQSAIENAQTSYDALSDEQKELVSNYEDLVSATEKISELKINHVQTLISDIGTVSLDSNTAIQIALSAYEDLSKNEEKSIENYDDLVDAQNEYERLTAENCIKLINAIGTVTLDNESKIEEARNAYTSLSVKAKKQVTNYGVLSEAEKTYTALEKEEEIKQKTLNNGDSFETSNWKITYKKTNISAKIYPNDTSGVYHYYHTNDDSIFVDLVFTIKNISSGILAIENLFGDCTVQYGSKTYSKRYTLYSGNGSSVKEISSTDGLDALNTATLHVAIVMPGEIKGSDESITVNLTVAGEDKIINVR
jgi:hypothetical protein